jgi:hypothetical protein
MDYVTASSMEWMEMDARTIHFHVVDTWTVDVEWIASLVTRMRPCLNSSALPAIVCECAADPSIAFPIYFGGVYAPKADQHIRLVATKSLLLSRYFLL